MATGDGGDPAARKAELEQEISRLEERQRLLKSTMSAVPAEEIARLKQYKTELESVTAALVAKTQAETEAARALAQAETEAAAERTRLAKIQEREAQRLINLNRQIKESLEDIGEEQDRLNRSINGNLALQKSEKEGSEEWLRLNREIVDSLEETNKLRKREIQERIKLAKLNKKDTKELDLELRKINERIKEHSKLLEEATKRQERFDSGVSRGATIMKEAGNSIGLVNDGMSDFITSMETAEGRAGVFKGLKKGFTETFSSANIFSAVITTTKEETIKLFDAIDKGQSSLRKDFTGALSDKLITNTYAIERSLRSFNIGYQETMDATKETAMGLSLYEESSADFIQTLNYDSALFAKMGTTNQEYTDSINTMIMALGQSEQAAVQNMRKFTLMSGILRKSKSQIIKEFREMDSYLAQFGGNSISVFTNLEALSTKSGVSISKLAGVTEKLSTLGGAADVAGSLNALLGAPLLSSLELLTEEDPAAQLKMIFDAIKKGGRDLNDPRNRFAIKEMAKITGYQEDEVKKMAKAYDEGGASLTAMTAAMKKFDDVSTKAMEKQVTEGLPKEELQQAIGKNMAFDAETVAKGVEINRSFLERIGEMQKQDPYFVQKAGIAAGGVVGGLTGKAVGAVTTALGAGAAGATGAGAAGVEASVAAASRLTALKEAANVAAGAAGVGAAGLGATGAGAGGAGGAAALRAALNPAATAGAGAGAGGLIDEAVTALKGVFSKFPSILKSAPNTGEAAKQMARTITGSGPLGKVVGTATKMFGPAAKVLPYVGSALNIWAAAMNFGQGKWVRGLLNSAAAIANLFPGGQTLALGLNAALLGMDAYDYFTGGSGEEAAAEVPPATGMATGGIVTREMSNITMGERGRAEAVIPLQDGHNHLAEPLQLALERFAKSSGGSGGGVVPNINLTVVLEGRELQSYIKNVIGDTLNPLR